MNTSRTAYFSDQTLVPLLGSFVYFQFNFAAQHLIVINDEIGGAKQVVLSFDGTNVHAKINPGEKMILDFTDAAGVWLKFANEAPAYRIMARPEAAIQIS